MGLLEGHEGIVDLAGYRIGGSAGFQDLGGFLAQLLDDVRGQLRYLDPMVLDQVVQRRAVKGLGLCVGGDVARAGDVVDDALDV